MFSEPVKDLLMIVTGVILIHRGYAEWKRGIAVTVWALYPRDSRPIGYWLSVILMPLIGAIGVVAGATGLLSA